MVRILVLLALLIPPWIASELDAPKWGIGLSVIPFFLFAMTLDDPDEDLLGEASRSFRKGTLLVVVAGGLILAGVLWSLSGVLF